MDLTPEALTLAFDCLTTDQLVRSNALAMEHHLAVEDGTTGHFISSRGMSCVNLITWISTTSSMAMCNVYTQVPLLTLSLDSNGTAGAIDAFHKHLPLDDMVCDVTGLILSEPRVEVAEVFHSGTELKVSREVHGVVSRG